MLEVAAFFAPLVVALAFVFFCFRRALRIKPLGSRTNLINSLAGAQNMKRLLTRSLEDKDGVVGVGVRSREYFDRGVKRSQYWLVIYARDSEAAKTLPTEFDGTKVEHVLSGAFKAHSADDCG